MRIQSGKDKCQKDANAEKSYNETNLDDFFLVIASILL